MLSLLSHWQDGLAVSTDYKKILVNKTEWCVYWVSVPNSVIRRIYLELKTRPLTVARFVAGMREKWESFHSSPAWAECRELLNSLLETFLLSPFSRLLSHFIEDSQRYRWIDTKDTIDTIASIYNRYIQYRIESIQLTYQWTFNFVTHIQKRIQRKCKAIDVLPIN